MSISAAAIAPSVPRRWLAPVGLIAAATTIWLVVYWEAIRVAVQTWWISPTYSHCILILPIVLYLIWMKRAQLAELDPDPFLPGLLLAVPAAFLWLAGRAAAVNEAQQLAALAMFQVILLAVLGLRIYRLLLFPFLFLFFLVPMGQYLVMPMQRLTTWFVSSGLSLLGILHYTEGNMIELANGTFQVAEACAGLRFLIANVVLCLLFAYLCFRRPYKIAIFMAAAVLVPLLANGLRALGIVLIAHWTDNRLAVGADHLIYGWGFSALVLLLLFGVGSRYRDAEPSFSPNIPSRNPAKTPQRFLLPLAGLLLLAVAAPLPLAAARNWLSPSHTPAVALVPPKGWTTAPVEGKWSPDLPAGDIHVAASLEPSAGGQPVDFLLDYYGHEEDKHVLSFALSRLWDEQQYNLLASARVVERIQGRPRQLSQLRLASGSERRLVWWSYWKNGQLIADGTSVRIMALKDALRPHTGIALIALSVPITTDEETARAALRAALWSFGSLPLEKN